VIAARFDFDALFPQQIKVHVNGIPLGLSVHLLWASKESGQVDKLHNQERRISRTRESTEKGRVRQQGIDYESTIVDPPLSIGLVPSMEKKISHRDARSLASRDLTSLLMRAIFLPPPADVHRILDEVSHTDRDSHRRIGSKTGRPLDSGVLERCGD